MCYDKLRGQVGRKEMKEANAEGKVPGVMVEDPPTSFSPFSLMDCMLLSHFSFNDFVTVAFPDLARDLDFQI